jgi:hypothetical protein
MEIIYDGENWKIIYRRKEYSGIEDLTGKFPWGIPFEPVCFCVAPKLYQEAVDFSRELEGKLNCVKKFKPENNLKCKLVGRL